MKKNYFKKASIALSFAALFGSANVNAQVLVGATAGSTGPIAYPTLNQAFNKVNDGTHQGVITMSVVANTTETALNPLFASGVGSASYTSISIMPSGGNFTISSATPVINRGIIELVGADNVTIDGDDPATAGLQNLTIVSTNTTIAGVACIRLASNSTTGLDGANNNTIKNCVLKGSRDAGTAAGTATIVNYGIQFSDGVAASSFTAGAYSSTNTIIQGNNISRCYYGIHAIGNSTTYLNTGLSILSNTIGNAASTDAVAFRGIDVSYTSINPMGTTANIMGNDIRTGHAFATSAISAIEIADANAGIRISRNNIHDCINTAAANFGMYGINISSAISNDAVFIRNNFIRDMRGGTIAVATQSTGVGGIGIMITASVSNVLINNNTIAQLAAGNIGSCIQVNNANASIAQLQNNIMTNTVSNAFSTGIYTSGTLNISGGNVRNNNYFVAAAGNVGFYNNANIASLTTWSNTTNKDNASVYGLPNFISNTNLHIVPSQTTILESAGTGTANTNVVIDYDGDARPGPVGSIYGGASAPDIGADEFDGLRADCTNPTITVTSSSPSGTVCSAGSVTLTASATGGGTPTFTFNTIVNGTLTSTSGSSIVITPTAVPVYTVVGTSFGCPGATTFSLAIDQTPTVTAVSSATAICIGRTVSITGSGARTYTLSNGVANSGSFAPTSTATYVVSGSNACGTVTTPITITVNPLPTLTISASNPTICSGATVALTVSGNASTYTWTSVAGSPTTAVVTVTPPAATSATSGISNYSVTATSAQGCTATAVNAVTVITTPVIPPLASPPILCSGNTETLQTTGATNYTWLPGGQTTSLIMVTPPPTTTITQITYTVIKSNGSCFDTQSITFQQNPLPTLFAIVNPTAVCAGSQASLTAGGALSYTWAPVVGTPTSGNIIVSPVSSTNYTYSGNDGTCTAVSTISVPVNPIPTITVSATPTTVCSGSPSTLTASGALSYSWTSFLAPTTTLTGSPVVITPTTTITWVVVGPNSFGCIGSASQVVFVNPLPNLSVSPASTLICLGKTVTLTASTIGGTSTYLWDANANNASTPVVTVAPTASTVITFTGTGTNGCPATKTVAVNVFNPAFTTPSNVAVCFGSTLALVSSGAFTYTWLPGNAHTASIAVNPTVNTTYSVSGTNTVQNNSTVLSCRADYILTVTVNPNPTVTAVADHSIICRGETSTLTATALGGVTSYSWLPAPASGTGSMVVVNSQDDPNYVNAVTYSVTGKNANNCKHTATVQVITSGCVGIESTAAALRDVLIFPNPSTGEFTVKSDDAITLTLINQMGQAIRTITLSDLNDHKATVSDVANGIYFIVGANENGRVSQKVIISK